MKNVTTTSMYARDYDMSLNWSRNLRDGGDRKAIRQSYDGNIILTRYKWFIAGVYLDRGTDIDSHTGSRTFVKRSRLSARPSHLLSFFRDFWTARYQKSLVVAWRTVFNGWEIKHPTGANRRPSDDAIKRTRSSFGDNERDISRLYKPALKSETVGT